MRCNCAMTDDEEGVDVEGSKEIGGVDVSVYGRFSRSWASLHLTIATSMAHITEKCVDFG